MNAVPQVSVIVAAYNVAPYVERAIRSALAQEGVTLEVIVVDDTSPDGTYAIANSITDSRLKVILSSTNGGPSAARNRAISEARGSWIAVLDGDDVYLPGRLARLVALVEAQSADIVVDNQEVFRESDGSRFEMFPRTQLAAMPVLTVEAFIAGNVDFIAEGHYGLGYFKPLFRAEFLRRHSIRYNESIRIGEDYLLMLEALARGAQCAVCPEPGYGYTLRASSISYRLTQADVERIQREDARFFATHTVSSTALAAQRRREKNLIDAYAFNCLVDAIKSRNFSAILWIAGRSPRALLYLSVPLKARLMRLRRRFLIGLSAPATQLYHQSPLLK